ncbi:MAG: 3'-5' exonuclease [Myxococcota bacterium]
MQRYLVIDLEATCDSPHNFPREQTEIIEIGAVVARADGTVERELQTFVKPRLHPITPFCTELTSIRPEDVADAPDFPAAIGLLGRFVREQSEPLLFCSWGAYDRNQLRRQAEKANVRLPLGRDHLNLKEAFQAAETGRRRGLGSALARAGLAFEGTAHRGIDDARNIARLLPYCLGQTPLPAVSLRPPRA